MTYNAFLRDVQLFGLRVARDWADFCRVDRNTQALWLRRIRRKTSVTTVVRSHP